MTHEERSSPARCGAPNCRRRAKPGKKTCGERSCQARLGHLSRPGHRQPQKHRCGLAGCSTWIERREGQCEADYRLRHYCDEHKHAAKGRPGRRKAVRAHEVRRPCQRDGCQRKFSSPAADQLYCGIPCAVASRLPGKRPTKVCQCGCGQRFERPPGIDTARWKARRFLDAEHRARAPKELKGGGKAKSPRANNPKPPRSRPAQTVAAATPAPPPVTPPRKVWRPANIGRDVRPRLP